MTTTQGSQIEHSAVTGEEDAASVANPRRIRVDERGHPVVPADRCDG